MGHNPDRQPRLLKPPPGLRRFVKDSLHFWLGPGKSWINIHDEIEITWYGRQYVIRIIPLAKAYDNGETHKREPTRF